MKAAWHEPLVSVTGRKARYQARELPTSFYIGWEVMLVEIPLWHFPEV